MSNNINYQTFVFSNLKFKFLLNVFWKSISNNQNTNNTLKVRGKNNNNVISHNIVLLGKITVCI